MRALCEDDGADKVIGAERSKTTYAFRSLLDTGARLAFGSDWPIAPASPLEAIYAATTLRTLDGAHSDGRVPEQKIALEEVLSAYTRDAAYTPHSRTIARARLRRASSPISCCSTAT